MNYEIIATPHFKRAIKKLVKKYHSLKEEYSRLISELEHSPDQGIPLGNS